MSLHFEVLGIAAPQGSLKAVVSRNNPKVAIVKQSNARTMPWRQEVAAMARIAVDGAIDKPRWPTDGPVELHVTFILPRPRSHFRKNGDVRPSAPPFPSTKPDLSKLVRAIEDALTGIVYTDDSRIVSQRVDKAFARGVISPRAVVAVIELDPEGGEG